MSSLARGRILVIDDDSGVSDRLKQLLESYLFYVRTADSVKSAMSELAQDRFDVIVLDWILPDGNGKDVIRIARETLSSTFIIVYSAYPSSDAECTPDADEFVEKSHQIQPLRNAVERGVRQSRERSRTELPLTIDDKHKEWFVDCFLDLLKSRIRNEGHLAIIGEPDDLCSGIARRLAAPAEMTHDSMVEMNVADYPEHKAAIQLFGCSVLDNGNLPSGKPGILENGAVRSLVLRNPDLLSQVEQETLAECIRSQRVRRIGSGRDFGTNVRLLMTLRPSSPGREPQERLSPALFCLIRENVLQIPTPAETPGGFSSFLDRLVDRACGSEKRLSPTIQCLSAHISPSTSWSVLQSVVDSQRFQSSKRIEIEELGLSFFESAIVRRRTDGQHLAKWSEVVGIAKAVYICRILADTNGNITQACRLSGLRRNTVYDVLREFEIDSYKFRREARRIEHQS